MITEIVILILILLFWYYFFGIYEEMIPFSIGYLAGLYLISHWYRNVKGGKEMFRDERSSKEPDSAESEANVADTTEWDMIFDAAPAGYRNETMVRAMFNKYVVKGKFEEVDGHHESWLKDGDKSLSLDGYNKVLGVAFEYQGPSHYEDQFNDRDKFWQQRENDDTKVKLCRDANISLIIIHYAIPFGDLENYVKSRLFDLGILKGVGDAGGRGGRGGRGDAGGKKKKEKTFVYLEVVPEPERKSTLF